MDNKENKSKKIFFMPYKITMWDSLETIYEEAIKDKEIDVKVIPIPYYEKATKSLIYEGEKFTNRGVDIVHYDTINLELEKPQVIFIHNIYDEYNTITEIHSKFFTKNLKKYTDNLIYIPYNISSPVIGSDQHIYDLKSLDSVDKIIVSGDSMKKTALIKGIPKEKVIVMGSPKFDKIINKNIDFSYDKKYEEYEKIIEGKKVVLLNTGCLFFQNFKETYDDIVSPFRLLENIFNIARFYKNTIIIWRPHPLTEESLKKYNEYINNSFNNLKKNILENKQFYENIIIDDSDDYRWAICKSDILVSHFSSLVNSFLVTKKPVILVSARPKPDKEHDRCLLPYGSLYYLNDNDESYLDFLERYFANGYDYKKEIRENSLDRLFSNLDGKCGFKIFKYIKSII